MKVHFVVHESFEAPGAYETWARERGFEAGHSRVHDHEPLPRSIDDIDLLVMMGGPQSPSTTREECPHFDAAAECALIARCVDGGEAVVGVCLGAQLLGEALGARCEHSPEREIGKFPIMLTPEGKANEVIERLITASGREPETFSARRFVQPPEVLRTHDYGAMNQKLYGFLDRLVEAYADRRGQR